MRKITAQAADAFIQGRPFKSGNTQVITADFAQSAQLKLHGNMIAERHGDNLFITNAGWSTTTTKDRLNALPGVSIHQKDFTWYLNGREWTGELVQVHRNSGWTYIH